MAKFKQGDKVVYTGEAYQSEYHTLWKTYEVVRHDGTTYPQFSCDYWVKYMTENNFKLASELTGETKFERPKYWIVKWDPKHPSWVKFMDWLHTVNCSKHRWGDSNSSYYWYTWSPNNNGYDARWNLDKESTNPTIITLEQWNEAVNGVTPEATETSKKEFEVGDRVTLDRDIDKHDFTVGGVYTVCRATDDDGDIIIEKDDEGDKNYWPASAFSLYTGEMPEEEEEEEEDEDDETPEPMGFKVWDIVTLKNDIGHENFTFGKNYTVARIDKDDEYMGIRVLDDEGDAWWHYHADWQLANEKVESQEANPVEEDFVIEPKFLWPKYIGWPQHWALDLPTYEYPSNPYGTSVQDIVREREEMRKALKAVHDADWGITTETTWTDNHGFLPKKRNRISF